MNYYKHNILEVYFNHQHNNLHYPFGPQDVYFVVGRNKVTDNLHEAIDRARNVAAPLNAKRLNKKTPCVIDLKCHDCKGPERICRNMQILFKAPSGCKYHVIIINEDLGY